MSQFKLGYIYGTLFIIIIRLNAAAARIVTSFAALIIVGVVALRGWFQHTFS